SPRLQLRAALLTAKLNHQHLDRLDDAERAYRAALELAPDNVEAITGLANLLSLCGRLRDAVPYALQLVRLGVETSLLVLLTSDDAVVNDPMALERARQAAPDDANPRIGLAWHAAQAGRTDEALALLRDALRHRPELTAARLALGQQLLIANQIQELIDWSANLPAAAEERGETWLIRAQIAERTGDAPAAIRCYWECLRREPQIILANSRIARLLAESGATEPARQFADYAQRLQHLDTAQHRLLSTRERRVEPVLELARSNEAVGRLWEAYAWYQFAASLDGRNLAAQREWQRVMPTVAGLPLRLVADPANVALAVDLSDYPLPHFRTTPVARVATGAPSAATLSFRDEASASGLNFRYFNGSDPPGEKRMFELTGGGIGVLDFDVDGFPDVFCTQGRAWPPTAHDGEHRDRFFWNRGGDHFEDVTDRAGFQEQGFGQGIAIGDYNADGFADVYVANIGANVLWRNDGDGTFTNATVDAGLQDDDWTTSCVLADLTGDGLPDLYDVNYLTDLDVFDRVCRHADGSPKQCMPFDFHPQPDRFWQNAGDGRFVDATQDAFDSPPQGMGLGTAVWDADGTGRMSLLVANDTTRNFFFVNEPAADGSPHFRECGIETGLALNGSGKATGCMGVALGDVDDDGRIDVYITNFLGESNTLYLNLARGAFDDRTRSAELYAPSLNKLGFGTQFLDADLDGRLELFVSNGHVDDLTKIGRPYRMPPQLYRSVGPARFAEVSAGELGPYFQKNWLGRPAARLDWNRDGREDLLVGHLYDDAALLTNTTPDPGRCLALRLIGVQSNRDAIGATVRATIGDRTIVRQLTAGDGYQASNERRLILGAGGAERIDELRIAWPSGLVQVFEGVATAQELWLVEGRTPLSPPWDGLSRR
ncbi:MAG TPA: FG-GAP-like repeat-containing protein, partial [Planctomycetaceae bacterium]|nr:FG-GAP-like repeat-containing protein [Planctomycetaceae bacterium]